MSVTKFEKDMNIIAALSDEPNAADGLSAAGLKAKFDEGGLAVQAFLNGPLAADIDAKADRTELAGLALGQIPDGTLSAAKLAAAGENGRTLCRDDSAAGGFSWSGYGNGELLSAASRARFGLGEDAVPDDALQRAACMAVRTYTGTGATGADNPNSLTFGFAPKVLLFLNTMTIAQQGTGGDVAAQVIAADTQTVFPAYAAYVDNTGETSESEERCELRFTFDGTTVSWYSAFTGGSAGRTVAGYGQLNAEGTVYTVVALG